MNLNKLIDVTELCDKYVKDAMISRFPEELEKELDKLIPQKSTYPLYFLYNGNIVKYSFDEKSTYFTKPEYIVESNNKNKKRIK